MLRKLTLLLITAVAFSQTTQVAPKQPPKPYELPEAYEVYAALLTSKKNDKYSAAELLIAQDTVPFHECLDRNSYEPALSAIEEYNKVNRTNWRLQQKFNLDRQYKLLSATEISGLWQHDPERRSSGTLSGGVRIISLSAVGFNPDKTIAFVAMSSVCGNLCGYGETRILQKRDGKWDDAPPIRNPDGTTHHAINCNWNY
jgi:hypothetical protein